MLTKVAKRPGSDIDTFNITQHGLAVLQVTQTSVQSSKLSEFLPESMTDITINTDFGLVLTLGKLGWRFERGTPSRKTQEYKEGGEKVWYFHAQTKKDGINEKYLTVLKESDRLFRDGLESIFHWQLKVYYTALLTVPPSELPNVRPWQPRSYYMLLLQKQKCPKKKKHVMFSNCDDDNAGQVIMVWCCHQV